jgi:putative heme iron utilization protein
MESPKQQGLKSAAALIKAGGTGSLSVIDIKSGGPFVTLVNIATDQGLRPLILTSALSHHTQCLKANPRASIMLHAPLPNDGDPLTALRVTLTGVFQPVDRTEAEATFLTRHPYAELYAGLGDFGFWRIEPEHTHIIAGFGRAYSVPFKGLAERVL